MRGFKSGSVGAGGPWPFARYPVAFLAIVSVSSFPGTPWWAGIQ